ncbi:hypothetical protein AVEN_212977-1 [Araneus ventricosus]|uniref:Uncharacterized protein n=1 Tax=Araneus ventricosus TaxID=182803 RepID=A0A4Y2MGL6_ARAVE|nr:hypothetical protein AVEN_212977-1 [Araneus ventricosus]
MSAVMVVSADSWAFILWIRLDSRRVYCGICFQILYRKMFLSLNAQTVAVDAERISPLDQVLWHRLLPLSLCCRWFGGAAVCLQLTAASLISWTNMEIHWGLG